MFGKLTCISGEGVVADTATGVFLLHRAQTFEAVMDDFKQQLVSEICRLNLHTYVIKSLIITRGQTHSEQGQTAQVVLEDRPEWAGKNGILNFGL